jgi:actin-related protein
MNSLNALYSEGLTSGLVFECGEGLSSCVPIVDGYVLNQSIQRLDRGGRDVNADFRGRFHFFSLEFNVKFKNKY